MAADNVKTAFRLANRVNEDFIRNLIWLHHQQQQYQQIISRQQLQNTKQFTSKDFSKYISGKDLC